MGEGAHLAAIDEASESTPADTTAETAARAPRLDGGFRCASRSKEQSARGPSYGADHREWVGRVVCMDKAAGSGGSRVWGRVGWEWVVVPGREQSQRSCGVGAGWRAVGEEGLVWVVG